MGNFKEVFSDRLFVLLLGICVIQSLINLIGVLGPETAFDALWYHLTLPKLFLAHHSIYFIPGGLLYYSPMPKFGEVLYAVALALHGEILAKLFHFFAGIGVSLVLYQFVKKISDRKTAILSVVILSANLVFAWESTTAYIDLWRTLFELLSFVQLYEFLNENHESSFYVSAVFMGCAMLTKSIAIGSLGIAVLLLIIFLKRENIERLWRSSLYGCIAFLFPLPWLIFSYLHTGNPFYPIFSIYYPTIYSLSLIHPFHFLSTFWQLLTHAADPISPLYLIFLPLLIFMRKRMRAISIVCVYSILSLLVWYITPDTGGGRFVLPYLPEMSLLVAYYIMSFRENKYISTFFISIVLFVSLITIGYRGIANARYIPVLLGSETKDQFLTTHLNFTFGDFFDIDHYFANHIHTSDRVLLIGFHNLYYVNFPYVDSSWIQKGERFNYIALQHTSLPKRFSSARKIYENTTTGVQLYRTGGAWWVY